MTVDQTERSGRIPTVEIDAIALQENWARMVALAAPGRPAAVVKADAYGLGVQRIVPILAQVGCAAWYVATVPEAICVRQLTGPGAAISVLNGPDPSTINMFAQFGLTPVLNALEQIALWKDHGPRGAAAAIHADTGMNRLGLDQHDWSAARDAFARPCMLISHLACAWTPDHQMNQAQMHRFAQARAVFACAPASLASSAGAVLGPEYVCDEIRVGIGLYGVGDHMRPAVRFTAPVLQVRALRAGCSTGYDALYTARADMDIACIGAGYADGVLRCGANGGYGFIRSERRALLGRVSMDSAMIDVHDLTPPVRVGDTVELFGPNLPIRTQAQALGVSDYVLLTALGPRVARTVRARAAT